VASYLLRALFKLLPDPLLALVHSKPSTGSVSLHFFEAAFLKRCQRRLDSSLRVPINLGVARPSQGKRVEGVVDARGAKRRQALRARVVVIELGEVKTLRLFDRRLGVLGVASAGRVLLLLSKQSFSLSLLLGCLGFLLGFGFPAGLLGQLLPSI